MNRNATAYSLLFTIHAHLIQKHHVPSHLSDSYRLTITHALPFYAYDPHLADQLQKSILIRNRVCHFKPISSRDVLLLKSLCDSLHINQSKKVGI